MAAERHTVENGTPVTTLMERAGNAVFEEIIKRFQPQLVQVICGPGNNGGDGYVVARLLQERGWPVEVIAPSQPNKAHSYALWQGTTRPFSPDSLAANALFVDAIFGIGLVRDLDDSFSAVVSRMNEIASPIVAIDIPTGVHTDTGHIMGFAAQANLTITFNFRKPGHLLLPGREKCGELVVHNIGLLRPEDESGDLYVNHPSLWQHLYPLPTDLSHKYNRGYLNILGGPEMTGAARLAASSARRMGVGMTRIESLPVSHDVYKAECVGTLTRAISRPEEFANEERVSAALIGPGSGRSEFTKKTVLAWLDTEKPCVLDADALFVFKDNPQELFGKLYPEVVLTPHEGEFQNLFNVTGNKMQRAQEAARLCRATILLKGADTVIAHPSGLTFNPG